MRRQLVERDLDHAHRLEPAEIVLGLVGRRRRDRLDGRPDVGRVLRQHDMLPLTADALVVVCDLVAADRAQPSEEGRLAAV